MCGPPADRIQTAAGDWLGCKDKGGVLRATMLTLSTK